MNENPMGINSTLRSDFSDTGIFGMLNAFGKQKEQNQNGQEVLSRFPAETPIAMAYVPFQYFEEEYEPSVAFQKGTLFPELDKPFMPGGKR